MGGLRAPRRDPPSTRIAWMVFLLTRSGRRADPLLEDDCWTRLLRRGYGTPASPNIDAVLFPLVELDGWSREDGIQIFQTVPLVFQRHKVVR